MKHWAILTDVTKCIGCASCIRGCREANDTGEDRPRAWQENITDLSASRWTTLDRLPEDHYVRRQCRHCLEPACASACPVGALEKTPEGAVVYDASICMGCRYCMMACPFRIPRYSWAETIPSVRKCVLCHERMTEEDATQPACTESCPVEATVFGEREELLREAKRRIGARPDLYVNHVWGESEAGGTAILNISDVPVPLPEAVPTDALPKRTWAALRTVPFVFLGMGAAAVGLRWLIGRRNSLAETAVPTTEGAPAEPEAPAEEDQA